MQSSALQFVDFVALLSFKCMLCMQSSKYKTRPIIDGEYDFKDKKALTQSRVQFEDLLTTIDYLA